MPSITIRDLPEEVLAYFRAEAKRERRSLNAQLVRRLELLREDEERRRDRAAEAERRSTELRARLQDFVARQTPFSLPAEEIRRLTEEAIEGDA